MIPGDIGDMPTLSSLNKPQKRALILRDQFRYLEPAHLDSYLDGVTADEPPTYKNINGTVHPPLAQVTIRDHATRFDLGNVQFPEEGGVTYRAYLTFEDGRFEMRTEDPLPRDDAELASVSIHRFVAENMFPLFKAKYKAIHARMEKINEARRVAYNMLGHPPAKFEDGETVARLNPAKFKTIEDASRDGTSRKRREIVKHASNKRQRIGLETIPENIKSETFNAIPAQVKVNLFDNIIKTAFPNFDNLIVASWNVVSVYANVGSDFPELHKAVVELKGALEEFESAYAPPRTMSGKSRKESTPTQQKSNSGSRTSTPVKEARGTPALAARSHVVIASQRHGDNSATAQRYQEDSDGFQHQMPPPRLLQATQQHHETSTHEAEHHPEPPQPSRARAHSLPRHAPESNSAPTAPRTPTCSPNDHPPPPRDCTRKTRDRTVDNPSAHLHAPGSELLRKRQEYTASLSKANSSSISAALGQLAQQDEKQQFEADREHGLEQGFERAGPELRRSGAGAAVFLGNSVLGGKKMGGVPVAPMAHVRRDGGLGGVRGRREY